MKKLIQIACFISLANTSIAQEVRLGLNLGTTPLKRVLVDTAIYSPANSYYTYIESSEGAGLIDSYKVFNSVNIGAILNFSYRRWSFNLEPHYFYERGAYRFKQPVELKRVIGAKGFRMPFYFQYKFFKKENSSYFIFGWNITKANYWDFQHPSEGFYFSNEQAYQGNLDVGDDHFKGILYDDQSYVSGILGLGKQFKKMNSSLRIQAPIGKVNERLPVQSWRIEWTFSWFFLSTKDFTNKHPLYIDE